MAIAGHYPFNPSWAITKDINIAIKMSPDPQAKPPREARQGGRVNIAVRTENMKPAIDNV